MIRITKKLKKNNFQPVEYIIYTEAEAKEKGISYNFWQKTEPGEYGISDDKYVSECISRNEYKTNTEMVYPFGRQWLGKTRKLEFEPHYASGNFCTVSTKPYSEIEAKTARAELAVDAFLTYKMAGIQPDLYKIGKLYRPDQENPVIAAKKLLKLKEVKKMIEEKLKEILVEKGVDEGYVLDVIKDAIDVAKVKESSSDMIRGAKELSIFLDMAPKTKQVTESVEVDMSHQIADSYKKQTKKLKATKTQDIDEKDNKVIGE
tara:strand:+ start:30756 stop:31538 length:783 start_codon:yes stop_codon:yes gene_type:complete